MVCTSSLLVAASSGETGVVGDLVIVLVAAGLSALIARRLGLAVIPGFLVAGTLLGPHVLGLVPAPDQLGAITHLAIVVLLFGIGLDLHLDSLRGRVVQLLAAALLACATCVAAGWALTLAFGLDSPRALLIGMAFALSSTAVVLKELAARRELAHPVGRLSIAILVVQDLAVVGMLASLPLLATTAGIDMASDAASTSIVGVLLRIVAVGAIMVAGRLVMGPLLKESLRGGGAELTLLIGLAFALGAAWATAALGFSLEMGAFLAGFVLSGTRFRHELAGQVIPIRDLFLAVFFTTLGMQIDPALLAQDWQVVLGATCALVFVKAALIFGSCWLAGWSTSISVATSLALSQAGEFSLVLFGEASGIGLLDERMGTVLTGVVVLSLLATPALGAAGRALALRVVGWPVAPWARGGGTADASGETRSVDVVVVGFGPVGQRVAFDLEEAGLQYVVVDLNPKTIARLQGQGRRAILGDMRNEAVLQQAGVTTARALVLTVPDNAAAGRACTLARRLQPDLLISARAALARAVDDLRAAGADHVVVDELASGDTLAQMTLEAMRGEDDA